MHHIVIVTIAHYNLNERPTWDIIMIKMNMMSILKNSSSNNKNFNNNNNYNDDDDDDDDDDSLTKQEKIL